MASPNVQWLYFDKKWCPMSAETCAILEKAYKAKGTGVVKFQTNNWSYEANLEIMTQKNVQTNVMSEIDRVETVISPQTGQATVTSLLAERLSGLHSIAPVQDNRDGDDDDDDTFAGLMPSAVASVAAGQTPQWEFYDRNYIPYNDSAAVEALYVAAGKQGTVAYSTSQHSYTLDFDAMSQTNTQTKVVRNIRRVLV